LKRGVSEKGVASLFRFTCGEAKQRSDSINHLLNGGKRLMSNTGTTGRIPLWLVGMVVGIAVIGIVSIYLKRKRTLQEKFDFSSNRKGKLVALSRN
jgi:hypothetical protein